KYSVIPSIAPETVFRINTVTERITPNEENALKNTAVIISTSESGIRTTFKKIPAILTSPNIKYITGNVVTNTLTEEQIVCKTFLIILFLHLTFEIKNGLTVISPRTAVNVSKAPASITAYGSRQIRNAA